MALSTKGIYSAGSLPRYLFKRDLSKVNRCSSMTIDFFGKDSHLKTTCVGRYVFLCLIRQLLFSHFLLLSFSRAKEKDHIFFESKIWSYPIIRMYGGNVVGSSPTASLKKSTKCYTDFCPSKYEKSLENQGFFGTKSISYIKDGSPCWT